MEVPAGLRVQHVVALDWEALVRGLPDVAESEVWAAPGHRWCSPAKLAADVARRKRPLWRVPHDDRVERQRSEPIDRPGERIYQRLEAVSVDVRRSAGRVLLSVQQLQHVLGAEQEPYAVDMRDLLRPALARGALHILGSCSLGAYRQYSEGNASMQRRFQDVCSRELTEYRGRHRV